MDRNLSGKQECDSHVDCFAAVNVQPGGDPLFFYTRLFFFLFVTKFPLRIYFEFC